MFRTGYFPGSLKGNEGGREMPKKIDTIYRLAIGVATLLLGIFADMSAGAKIVVFVISGLAFVEAYFKVPSHDPYSRSTTDSAEQQAGRK
jgi:hypothetical protein